MSRRPFMLGLLLSALVGAWGADLTAKQLGAGGWYLLEPPVDEASNVMFGILNQAPLSQWRRVSTYDSEAACEYRRNEAVRASREETLRLSKTSPLPAPDIFKGAYRDSGLHTRVSALLPTILGSCQAPRGRRP